MRLTAYLTHFTGTLHPAVMRILRAVSPACQGEECVRGKTRLILDEPNGRYATAEQPHHATAYAFCPLYAAGRGQAERGQSFFNEAAEYSCGDFCSCFAGKIFLRLLTYTGKMR